MEGGHGRGTWKEDMEGAHVSAVSVRKDDANGQVDQRGGVVGKQIILHRWGIIHRMMQVWTRSPSGIGKMEEMLGGCMLPVSLRRVHNNII